MAVRGRVTTPAWLVLDKGEQIVLRFKPSKNVLLGTFAGGTVLLLAVGALALTVDVSIGIARLLSGAVLVVIFATTAIVYLLTRRVEYAVTTQRVYRAEGFVSPDVESVPLPAVEEVTVDQTGWQALFNVGDLTVHGEEGPYIRFRYVEHPQWIREQITDQATVAA